MDVSQFWTTFDQNHTQKCGLSVRGCPRKLKMNDSWHLQHCWAVVWKVPVNFVRWAQHAVHCSKVCAKLISNVLCVFADKFHVQLLYDNLWTYKMICVYVCMYGSKLILHCCLHWTRGTGQKRPQLDFQLHYWWWILGCLGTTLRQSNSHLSGRLQLHLDQRKHDKFGAFFWRGGGIEGILHKEFVLPGQMVNCDLPWWSRENVQCKRSDKWCNNSWALHHDNAPAHASLVVRQFVASMNMTVMPHPSYSLGLTPCDFFLLPKMKLKLKGQHFDSIKEVHA
jgi:hypothetical protein